VAGLLLGAECKVECSIGNVDDLISPFDPLVIFSMLSCFETRGLLKFDVEGLFKSSIYVKIILLQDETIDHK
jgi:hypothetical protein